MSAIKEPRTYLRRREFEVKHPSWQPLPIAEWRPALADDESWGTHYVGRDEVRGFYSELLRALPDLQINVLRQHATNDAVVLETVIRGQHLGFWRGLPATGRHVEFSLCGIFTFDDGDRLSGERIYYDRATVLRQLGVFHEPEGISGRVAAVLMHPLTMLRIIGRTLLQR